MFFGALRRPWGVQGLPWAANIKGEGKFEAMQAHGYA